jgi:hypothetical protein
MKNAKNTIKKRQELNEAVKLEKKRQAKDKRSSKKAVGAVQTNSQIEIWELLLHLSTLKAEWKRLADRAHVGEGEPWSFSKIRHSRFTATMYDVQRLAGRARRRLLLKNAKRNQPDRNAKVRSRQTGKRKGARPLFETNVRLSRNFGRIK